jgi:hypothetical protein
MEVLQREGIEYLGMQILQLLDDVELSKEWMAAVRVLQILHCVRSDETLRDESFVAETSVRFTVRDLYYLNRVIERAGTRSGISKTTLQPRRVVSSRLSVQSIECGLKLLDKTFHEPLLRYRLGVLPKPKGILWAPPGYTLVWAREDGSSHVLDLASVPCVPPEVVLPGTSIHIQLTRTNSATFHSRTHLRAILVTEKETTFRSLLRESPENLVFFPRYAQQKGIAMLTGKGYPDHATIALVQILARTEQIPICILTDCDPDGVLIATKYQGTPGRIGIPLHAASATDYAALRPLTMRDRAMIQKLSRTTDETHISASCVRAALDEMKLSGYKVEIESWNCPTLHHFVISALEKSIAGHQLGGM